LKISSSVASKKKEVQPIYTVKFRYLDHSSDRQYIVIVADWSYLPTHLYWKQRWVVLLPDWS